MAREDEAEGRGAGTSMYLAIVGVRQWLDKAVPVCLVLVRVVAEAAFECLVIALSLAVRLGVIRGNR